MMITHKSYLELTALQDLYQAWDEFKRGKRSKIDVQMFERNLEDNLFVLYEQLRDKTYRHGDYQAFYVHDSKKRHIHKAPVTDRIVHHLLYKYLYEVFDRTFIFDSYSCRLEKGTHKGVLRLGDFSRIISGNNTNSCWALKLDIKKFFANVDHQILIKLLKQKIQDQDILWLLNEVIQSFCSCCLLDSRLRGNDKNHQGIPLGNLTSQVFANIYMNELDQFVKHQLKVKYYIRYADDFVLFSGSKSSLKILIDPVSQFLKNSLKLELHPNKIIFRKLDWGIDFLGYIVLPYYILPRTKTKKRIFTKLKEKIGDENFNQSLQSYLGYLIHANSYRLTENIKNQVWLWK